MRHAIVACLMSALIAGSAAAEEDWERERREESHQIELRELDKRLPKIEPGPGRDRATVQEPPWCKEAGDEGATTLGAIGRSLDSAKQYWSAIFDAARTTCRFPKEKVVHKAVAVIMQMWINLTGLPEAQALEAFKARLDAQRFEADQKKLCAALEISDEWQGEEKAFMEARRRLFNCTDKWPMWADPAVSLPDDLVTYLDASSTEVDELVRLAVVIDSSQFALGEPSSYFDKQLLSYIVHHVDYAALSDEKVLKLLDAAPYKGNVFARTVIVESLGNARMGIAAVEAAVQKKSSDPDWKELLVTAPGRGVAAWNKAAEKHRDAIARSNEFERAFWGPSRKAVRGCWAKLEPDFVAVARTLDAKSDVSFLEGLSDPIASLLFARLAACAAVDGGVDSHYAERLIRLTPEVRTSRGPRLAAYYAALDALSAILEDRTKFPVTAQDLPWIKSQALYDASFRALSGGGGMGFVGDDGAGVVKKVKKVKDGLQVTFVTEKTKVMSQSCTETNKIVTFRHDGTPIYYRSCRDTGMVTIDITPDDITIPEAWADNIAAGVWLEFESKIGEAPARVALPTAVYKDKAKKKLVNWHGFGL